ncbi:MAG TPA: hypothetical protein DD440_05965 [Porticoccaceae bacterium]|nr:hypothetical protein [Porticoccaceae bacterium]
MDSQSKMTCMKRMIYTALFMSVAAAPVAAGIGSHIADASVHKGSHGYARESVKSEFAEGTVLRPGEFRENDRGVDAAHLTKGSVQLIKSADGITFLQLGGDFNAGEAPDLYVYASAALRVDHTDAFELEKQMELGRLQNTRNASFYPIPPGKVVNSVTIWCKRLRVFMGSADLI